MVKVRSYCRESEGEAISRWVQRVTLTKKIRETNLLSVRVNGPLLINCICFSHNLSFRPVGGRHGSLSLKRILEDISAFCLATDTTVGFMVTSALYFKARLGPSFVCFLACVFNGFLRLT